MATVQKIIAPGIADHISSSSCPNFRAFGTERAARTRTVLNNKALLNEVARACMSQSEQNFNRVVQVREIESRHGL